MLQLIITCITVYIVASGAKVYQNIVAENQRRMQRVSQYRMLNTGIVLVRAKCLSPVGTMWTKTMTLQIKLKRYTLAISKFAHLPLTDSFIRGTGDVLRIFNCFLNLVINYL